MENQNVNDLFRSAVTRNAAAAAGTEGLYGKSESDLYALLTEMAADPVKAIGPAASPFRLPIDDDDLHRSNAATDLGKRIFARWSRAFHDFVCGSDKENKDLKDQILQAIFNKNGGGIAIIAGGLVAAFGLSPAIAAVIATLLIRLIVAPAVDEVCKAWGAHNEATAAK